MSRLTRRGFVKASGAIAAMPALTALSAAAQGPAPDTGSLRVEKDIVFGKGGSMDLTLDVYRPPEGVTSKRMAIVHLFGGLLRRQQERRLHRERCQGARREGVHEHLGELGDGGNAGVSSDVNACIGIYPLASAQIARGLFPQGQATPENIGAASPTSYISKTFAPTIFIHGTNDGTVPVQSSVDFWRSCTVSACRLR